VNGHKMAKKKRKSCGPIIFVEPSYYEDEIEYNDNKQTNEKEA